MTEQNPTTTRTAWWKKRWVHYTAVAFLAFIFGTVAGAGSSPTVEPQAAPSVTVTPEPEVLVHTVTPEAEVNEVVAQACLDALDHANSFIRQTGNIFGGSVAEMFDAAGRFDPDALEHWLGVFNEDGDRLLTTQASYHLAEEECRNG